MDYAEFYYSQVVGHYPFDTDVFKNKTQKVIDYLIDAGISENDILRFIEESPPKDFLTPDDLPDWLWEGSLLKKDTFYYHNTLHIKPKAPVFNPHSNKEIVEDFYLEMKIKFTMEDLINYFYDTLMISRELMDYKRDEGAFNHLLNRYDKLQFVESIDFVLALIDQCKPTSYFSTVHNVFDIRQAEAETFEMFKRMTAEAEYAKANVIVWR